MLALRLLRRRLRSLALESPPVRVRSPSLLAAFSAASTHLSSPSAVSPPCTTISSSHDTHGHKQRVITRHWLLLVITCAGVASLSLAAFVNSRSQPTVSSSTSTPRPPPATSPSSSLAVGASASAAVATASPSSSSNTNAVSDLTSADPSALALVQPPSRAECLARLQETGHVFDLLIIGGGATGSGIALDATLRGLSVALVEAEDFSSGASSRSTKLIHGGIRYLQKAFTQLDYGQYTLVTEALKERRHMLAIAPHLARAFPIVVPIYGQAPWVYLYAPYYWAGCKLYDLVAGKSAVLSPSYFLNKTETLRNFPMLKPEQLFGGVVYFDGQQNDTRMNVALVLTAAALGAAVANHVRVTSLIKHDAASPASARSPSSPLPTTSSSSSPPTSRTKEADDARIVGAMVVDTETQRQWPLYARQVVNATGPMSDHIRHMASPELERIITPSAGIHIVLPASYTPPDMGLIVPETSDGRVLFMLPWEGSTVAGTTDYLSELTAYPSARESDVQFLMNEISRLLRKPIERSDVRAVWSGIRPLAKPVKNKSEGGPDTQAVSRDHLIEKTAPGLLTIAGGKWTTYRKMAEDLCDVVIKDHSATAANTATSSSPSVAVVAAALRPIDVTRLKTCSTWCYPLLGAHRYTADSYKQLLGLDLSPASTNRSFFTTSSSSSSASTPVIVTDELAKHLTHNYGDRAADVIDIARTHNASQSLAPGHPFIEAEVIYTCQCEYATSIVDVIAHRIRLSFLDSSAASNALPRIADIMAKQLQWSTQKRNLELQRAKAFLATMNLSVE